MTRLALILALTTSVMAQDRAIIPFAGVQAGGELFIDFEKQPVDAAPVFGALLSFDRGGGRILDFLVSRQETEAGEAGVTVDLLQVGGRYLLRRDQRASPYIAATVGATRIGTGTIEALRLSFAGGAGAEIRIRPGLALLVDGRLYTTLFDDRGSFECDDTVVCVTGISGDGFHQFAGFAGLAFRF